MSYNFTVIIFSVNGPYHYPIIREKNRSPWRIRHRSWKGKLRQESINFPHLSATVELSIRKLNAETNYWEFQGERSWKKVNQNRKFEMQLPRFRRGSSEKFQHWLFQANSIGNVKRAMQKEWRTTKLYLVKWITFDSCR